MCTPAFWAIVAAAVTASLLPPWSSPSEISTMVAEPQWPRSGSSPSSPIVTDLPVIALSEPRMAAASDVPPEIRRFCTAALVAARSALGSDVVSAPWSKPTTPMSTVSGWASMNARAVCWAAASRLGATSSALMLLDTSIARMTVPALRPTGSAAAGPATATASTTTPASESHSPSCAAAPAGHRDPGRGQGGGPAPAREHGADDQRGGDQQAEDEQQRVGEAHPAPAELGLLRR